MSCFSGVLNQSDAFASLNRAWTTGSRPVGAVGLSETGKALVLHALYEQQKKPLLVLTPDEASAVKLTEDLRTLQGDVLLYPAREMNFVQVAGASHEYELLRLDVLSRMAAGAYGDGHGRGGAGGSCLPADHAPGGAAGAYPHGKGGG